MDPPDKKSSLGSDQPSRARKERVKPAVPVTRGKAVASASASSSRGPSPSIGVRPSSTRSIKQSDLQQVQSSLPPPAELPHQSHESVQQSASRSEERKSGLTSSGEFELIDPSESSSPDPKSNESHTESIPGTLNPTDSQGTGTRGEAVAIFCNFSKYTRNF